MIHVLDLSEANKIESGSLGSLGKQAQTNNTDQMSYQPQKVSKAGPIIFRKKNIPKRVISENMLIKQYMLEEDMDLK